MLYVPHTFCIKIGQITQFYLYLTYDQRFYSFMNRALDVQLGSKLNFYLNISHLTPIILAGVPVNAHLVHIC